MPRQQTLSPAAVETLRQATATDTTVTLHGQLDRNVFAEVNKALERIGGGGKWNRGRKLHVFPHDPRPEIANITGTGIMPINQDKAASWFPSPPEVAQIAAQAIANHRAETDPDGRVWEILEPSAGEGALVRALSALMPCKWNLVESDPGRQEKLEDLHPGDVAGASNFEEFYAAWQRLRESGVLDTAELPGGFDAVIMIPPFSGTGHPLLWAEHIVMAWDLTNPGGIVSAIAPASASTRGAARELGLLIDRHGAVQDLPQLTFRPSGTDVHTRHIVLIKPGTGSA